MVRHFRTAESGGSIPSHRQISARGIFLLPILACLVINLTIFVAVAVRQPEYCGSLAS